jgi:Ca-activated chloride channel family protein
VAVIALAGAAVSVTVHQLGHRSSSHTAAGALAGLSSAAACTRQVHVVTASSFVPVLNEVSGSLASGSNCVVIKTTVADGQGAAHVVASSPDADVWIPDDASWRNLPNDAKLSGTAGSVIATSPMYFVTVKNAPLPAAESSWIGLAAVLSQQTGTRLVIRDPAASADGLVAAGSMGDAVFARSGPLQSALDLMRAWQKGRMVTGTAPAFPQTSSEVAVVPEYALQRSGRADKYNVTAPTDATGMMRFTWNPTAAAAADPDRTAALNALHDVLTGPDSTAVLAAKHLRGPTAQPIVQTGYAAVAVLPAQNGKSLATLSEHHVWHVLTTWHPDQRKANILVVVDVSSSQGNTAPGSNLPLIQVVQQGVTQLATLLPPASHLGLWKFGYQLSPPNDYQVLAPTAALDPGQQQRFATATEQITAQNTGTALYDTILSAYKDQQAHFQNGMPNEVLIFTDGKNEAAPDSISIDQLKASLAATDPTKRVQIGVLAFRGPAFRGPAPVDELTDALSPVGGQVDTLNNANDVLGAFVHAVSGGLTHTT